MSPRRFSVRLHPGCCRLVGHVLCPGQRGHRGFLTATVPQGSRPGPAKPFCPRGHAGSRLDCGRGGWAWPECPEASVPWGSVGCPSRACWWERSGCRLWSWSAVPEPRTPRAVPGPRALRGPLGPAVLWEGLPWEGGLALSLSKALGESSHSPQTAPSAKPATELCWDSSAWPWGGGWHRDRRLVLTPCRTGQQASLRAGASSPAPLGAPSPTGPSVGRQLGRARPQAAPALTLGLQALLSPPTPLTSLDAPGFRACTSAPARPVTRTGRRHLCSPRPRPLSSSREAGPGGPSHMQEGRRAVRDRLLSPGSAGLAAAWRPWEDLVLLPEGAAL